MSIDIQIIPQAFLQRFYIQLFCKASTRCNTTSGIAMFTTYTQYDGKHLLAFKEKLGEEG